MDLENGRGYVASKLYEQFGKPGYGWQYRVNIRTIDDSKTVFFGETLRVQRLLKAAAASSSGEAKVHYQALLFQIERALKADDEK